MKEIQPPEKYFKQILDISCEDLSKLAAKKGVCLSRFNLTDYIFQVVCSLHCNCLLRPFAGSLS